MCRWLWWRVRRWRPREWRFWQISSGNGGVGGCGGDGGGDISGDGVRLKAVKMLTAGAWSHTHAVDTAGPAPPASCVVTVGELFLRSARMSDNAMPQQGPRASALW
jgi:hypothetical protein